MRGHRLTRDDQERRWIIGRILCHGELRAGELRDAFGRELPEAYARELASLEPGGGRRPGAAPATAASA